MTLDLDLADALSRAEGDARLAALAALAQQARDLIDAVALTDVPGDEITAVAGEIAVLSERLRATMRDRPRSFQLTEDQNTLIDPGNAVGGVANPHALPLVVEVTPERTVRADVQFRPVHAGPPGFVHGGVTSMVLDQLLGEAVAAGHFPAMTGTLTIRYRRPVPYGEPLVGTAEYTHSEGRKSWVEGRIALPDGTPLVEATGLFITPSAWVGLTIADVEEATAPAAGQ
ncbi:PaaI family thioesterase [Sinosporangium siamense]|uniref:Acyl-coenzyme A thioesterase THEM4 n=1 Tax=Sinosporangium siamense TaxID=1367973 RepID=A0A919V4J9_9ACTN|nr:PaaI family thioesterase [Sinosporangium siamense]GII89806.1 thioesterase [Sinosporangium siamense]